MTYVPITEEPPVGTDTEQEAEIMKPPAEEKKQTVNGKPAAKFSEMYVGRDIYLVLDPERGTLIPLEEVSFSGHSYLDKYRSGQRIPLFFRFLPRPQ